MNIALKEKILYSIKRSNFDMAEAGRAVSLVEDVLACMVEDMEENRPYATISIEETRKARSRVNDIYGLLEEM